MWRQPEYHSSQGPLSEKHTGQMSKGGERGVKRGPHKLVRVRPKCLKWGWGQEKICIK